MPIRRWGTNKMKRKASASREKWERKKRKELTKFAAEILSFLDNFCVIYLLFIYLSIYTFIYIYLAQTKL